MYNVSNTTPHTGFVLRNIEKILKTVEIFDHFSVTYIHKVNKIQALQFATSNSNIKCKQTDTKCTGKTRMILPL